MPHAGKPARLPRPHTILEGSSRHASVLSRRLCRRARRLPGGVVSVVVTSPPYNLGIAIAVITTRCRASTIWNGPASGLAPSAVSWPRRIALSERRRQADRSLDGHGGRAGRQDRTCSCRTRIHWIKSIAIDREAAGAAVDLDRDLAVGHYKPINSERFVNDCHEFIFHFTPEGRTPLDRRAIGVPYQDASNIARWQTGGHNRRCRGNTWFIPYDTIQSRDKDRPHPATFPAASAGVLFQAARRIAA